MGTSPFEEFGQTEALMVRGIMLQGILDRKWKQSTRLAGWIQVYLLPGGSPKCLSA